MRPPAVHLFLQMHVLQAQKALDLLDYELREITGNLIGRWLNEHTRDFKLKVKAPVVVFLDEAHNFLNQHLGDEDARYWLDAFEKLAKERRKYWLGLVLATQQPRDISTRILSQMGTLIVYRLINEADFRMVEMACGQIDAATAEFGSWRSCGYPRGFSYPPDHPGRPSSIGKSTFIDQSRFQQVEVALDE